MPFDDNRHSQSGIETGQYNKPKSHNGMIWGEPVSISSLTNNSPADKSTCFDFFDFPPTSNTYFSSTIEFTRIPDIMWLILSSALYGFEVSTGDYFNPKFSIISRMRLCTEGMDTKIPVLFCMVLPAEKSSSFPKISLTLPPASSTIILPAAWSQIFSL